MNSLRPKIKSETIKKDVYNGWQKCKGCAELIHVSELAKCCECCPHCAHHHHLPLKKRLDLLADAGTFVERFREVQPLDPLNFVDSEPYVQRMEKARKKTGRDESLCAGTCELDGKKVALAVIDFSFMGGSMGSVLGERLTRLIELACSERLPLIVVSSSGGARMQESVLSLMQMAKTSAALAKLSEARVPYISVLTNPTTGGVTASFATLGDVIVAEPKALIAFAGPRVVEQTIGHKLPPEAQKSEFLLEKGMVDCIVKRSDLKSTLSTFIHFFTGNQRASSESLAQKGTNRLKELLQLAEKANV